MLLNKKSFYPNALTDEYSPSTLLIFTSFAI